MIQGLRNLPYKERQTLAVVGPHLDYAVQFWSPHDRMDVGTLLSQQRRMTKTIHVGYLNSHTGKDLNN